MPVQIWTQLGFDLSLSHFEGDDKNIITSSQLLLTLTKRPFDHLHQRPPGGIQCICLETIHLEFAFSTCRPRGTLLETAKLPTLLAEELREFGPWDALPMGTNVDRPLNLPQHQESQPSYLSYHGPRTLSASGPAENSLRYLLSNMLGEEELMLEKTDKKLTKAAMDARFTRSNFDAGGRLLSWFSTEFFGTTIDPVVARRNFAAMTALSTDEDTVRLAGRSTPISEFFDHDVHFESMKRALDVSLRFILCDRRSAKSKGIYLSQYSGWPPMSTIAPALFNPGYLEVVAAVIMDSMVIEALILAF